MTNAPADPIQALRDRLRRLHADVRSPAYRTLEEYANLDGLRLPPSTIGTLLNGRGKPRWRTVAAFVHACQRCAQANRLPVPPDRFDLSRWRSRYRDLKRDVATTATTTAAALHGTGQSVVPTQLPEDLLAFIGRARELAALDRLLAPEASNPSPQRELAEQPPMAVIFVVSGTAGVGKTTLAVHWAHRVAHHFPDGQLYLDLRGFDPAGPAMEPAEAVRRLLVALGVEAKRIPVDLDSCTALYRSLLAGKRILVILDNARDAGQISPLRPGAPTCLLVVASRNRLTNLVTTGAIPIVVDLLTADEARELLARRLGCGRVTAEPAAIDEIVTRCAGLPLALAIVAARAASQPGSLSAVATDLRDARTA